jgi:2-alkyl-3-oxoalkanoate reductase
MKCVVTGGAGFLGRHLVERLVKDGENVTAADFAKDPLKDVENDGIETALVDLRDYESAVKITKGKEVVFHTAALASPWDTKETFWSLNVTATDNVIKACNKNGVKRLVHVSSPSAIFDGSDHFMSDETVPYPEKFLSHYCETKAISEKNALSANTSDLETVAIRPHIIWGPRDKNIMTRLYYRAKAGKLKIIGDGKNEVSTLYVENGVEGLVCAAKSEKAPGNVYFLTNDEPVNLWDFVNRILTHLDAPVPETKVPFAVAYYAGGLMEIIWSAFKLSGEPLLTRYTASELAKNHTYSIQKAKDDLGYKPIYTVDQGLEKVFEYIDKNGLPENPA